MLLSAVGRELSLPSALVVLLLMKCDDLDDDKVLEYVVFDGATHRWVAG